MNCRHLSDGENTCMTTHGDTFQSNNVSQYDDQKPALKLARNSFLRFCHTTCVTRGAKYFYENRKLPYEVELEMTSA